MKILRLPMIWPEITSTFGPTQFAGFHEPLWTAVGDLMGIAAPILFTRRPIVAGPFSGAASLIADIRRANFVTAAPADKAVVPCFGLARQKLPYVQGLAGDGNWAVSDWQL